MLWQRRSRVALTVVCALALLLSTSAPAFAGLNDLPVLPGTEGAAWPVGDENAVTSLPTIPAWAFSATNPADENHPDSWWRQGWGNSLAAHFDLAIPVDTVPEGQPRPDPTYDWVLGAMYVADRDPNTDVNELTPYAYDHATQLAPTGETDPYPYTFLFRESIDILGSYVYGEGDTGALYSGARYGYEGPWWLHYNFYSQSDVATRTLTIPFGIDVTPPTPVRKVTVRPSTSYTGPTDIWFESARAYVTWEDMEYDALSGVVFYEVLLNDEVVDDRVWHLSHTARSITIENMPPGVNQIQVVPVDRATNRGPAQTVTFKSDTDIPVVEVTAPAKDGATMPLRATFAATATDGAGIEWVDFAIDGTSIYTDKSAPYAVTWNMGAYSVGPHTLTVTAKDMFGHTATAKRTFYVDKTIPKISSVSDAPDPFYPIIQEGYKDTMTVQFYTSEGGKCALYIHNAAGTRVATRSKASIGSGWQSISWDGQIGEGVADPGTYNYKVKVVDAAGNVGWSGTGYTTIRDYEIIRVAPNAVKIVPR